MFSPPDAAAIAAIIDIVDTIEFSAIS